MKKVDFGAKRPTVVKPAGGGEIDNWVSHQATGVEPTKRLTIEVPISLHKRFKSGCAIENLVMADVVREFLEKRFPPTAPSEQGGGES
jgi:hypothetical protein